MVEDFGPGSATEDPAIAQACGAVPSSCRWPRLGGAWTDAGLDRLEGQFDPHRAAVVVGSAFGGLDLLEAEQERMIRRRSLAVSPYLVPAMIINQAAGQVAQHLRLYGPAPPRPTHAHRGACGRLGSDVLAIGRCRTGPLRRRRERVHAAGGQRFRDDEGALGTQARRSIGTKSSAGQPSVQRRPGRLRPGGGGRVRWSWPPNPPSAGWARSPGRAGGVVDQLRRLPHGDAVSRTHPALPGDRARSRPG